MDTYNYFEIIWFEFVTRAFHKAETLLIVVGSSFPQKC